MGVRTSNIQQLSDSWKRAVGQPLQALIYLTHSLSLRDSEVPRSEDEDLTDDLVKEDDLIRVRFGARVIDEKAQIYTPQAQKKL